MMPAGFYEEEDCETVVFFRSEGFYPVLYPKEHDAWEQEAANNPGTTRIEKLDGTVLWTAQPGK